KATSWPAACTSSGSRRRIRRPAGPARRSANSWSSAERGARMIGFRNAALAALFAIAASAPLAAQGQGSYYEPDPSLEGTRVGTRAADFLKMGVGARALALG